jgi:uncharacterized protein
MRIRTIAAGVLIAACLPAMAMGQAAPPPSAHQLELAKRVMDDVGGEKMIDQIMNAMMGSMTAQMATGQSKELQDRTRTVIMPALQATMSRVMPKMMDVVTVSYAQTFSEQELNDIDAFYRSPSGRAMIAKMPQMMTSTMQAMGPIQIEIRQDFAQEVCQRMTCTSAIRAAMEGKPPSAH